MKIRRLELTNFRTFGHVVLEDLPDTVILVSPNGVGKSSILEAIAGAKDLIVPYHQENYPYSETWERRDVKVWPAHLPNPVRIGEPSAEILIEVEPNPTELDWLESQGQEGRNWDIHIVIEDGRRVTESEADQGLHKLLQFHEVSSGIGLFDYIRPMRIHTQHTVGDFARQLADDRTRGSIGEFHLRRTEQKKFGAFKSYVVASELNDLSTLKETGERVDSLSSFRDVFDFFFSPKKFVGCRQSEDGQPEVVVRTPFGEHDVDALSDGEKEMLHIIGHLYRFRQRENIVLWDTPELHLNAALESRLYQALQQVAPDNQYWVATHSLELINSVPLDSLFALRLTDDGATAQRLTGHDRRAKLRIYRELGAQTGLQLVSTCVAFCEGEDAHSDKRHLERLVGRRVPGVAFVAGGGCRAILSSGTKANALLEEVVTNGDFLAIVDRDFRSKTEVAELEGKDQRGIFVWGVHEFENLMMAPEIVHTVLEFHDRLGSLASIDDVKEAINAAADSLSETIAGQWAAFELTRSYPIADRVTSAEDTLSHLLAHAEALRVKLEDRLDVETIEQEYEEKLAEVDRIIEDGKAWQMLPGKELLRQLLHQQNAGLSTEQYLTSAVSLVTERDIEIPEIERLVDLLKTKVNRQQGATEG